MRNDIAQHIPMKFTHLIEPREGMPYLLMKARALGCRILATDCPGNSDVLAGYEKWEVMELRFLV